MIIRAISKGQKGYEVYFNNGKLLALELKDEQYAGVSYWADYWGVNDATIEEGHIFGYPIINYSDLPPMVQAQIEKVLSELED